MVITVQYGNTVQLDFWKKYGTELRLVFFLESTVHNGNTVLFFRTEPYFSVPILVLIWSVNDCLLTAAINVSEKPHSKDFQTALKPLT